ncbi:MAG TPA: (Fe-S)-binding protein [Desulfomonilaceae bacterium]|nr:(Fe-S)-binding protein [Desulfomonilaceae bacterium]
MRAEEISKQTGQPLETIRVEDLPPLPPPYEDFEEPPIAQLKEDQKVRWEHSLDGVSAINLPRPQTPQEEQELVEKFLNGFRKLLTKENNWAFLQPLLLSLEYCAKCQTCAEACPVYEMSGRKEIYRPIFRAEVLRKIGKKYLTSGGRLLAGFRGHDIDLNWETVARLAELAYRCTLCRRCTQVCPVGVDNGLITHELRKILSQELGIAPAEIHEKGTVKHLTFGSSTGMTQAAIADILEYIEDDIEEKIGRRITIPLDKKGADILLLHNAGEFMSWPENPMAFAILFDAAGINYTLSTELTGYDAVNYGLWYDDVQFARVALKHLEIARDLGVKKIIIGECGHAHKALTIIADRLLPGEQLIPRESSYTLLWDIVKSGKIKFNPTKNDFPVTLHDPCNIVRLMGIVEPQRNILRAITPPGRFREMTPHGVENYCCGGGSGFAIMSSGNFPDWKRLVSGRKKLSQILNAFQGEIDPSIHKMVCAPCSNCKGMIRDLFENYEVFDKTGIWYTGLVELMVNAMVDIEKPFIEWPGEDEDEDM